MIFDCGFAGWFEMAILKFRNDFFDSACLPHEQINSGRRKCLYSVWSAIAGDNRFHIVNSFYR
jgi:hypothetical protein